jgi:hypothetical protein
MSFVPKAKRVFGHYRWCGYYVWISAVLCEPGAFMVQSEIWFFRWVGVLNVL